MLKIFFANKSYKNNKKRDIFVDKNLQAPASKRGIFENPLSERVTWYRYVSIGTTV